MRTNIAIVRDMGNYEVYVRSTSNNRKLYANSNVLVRA